MALLRAGSLQEAIADRDLAPRHNLGVNAHVNMAESALKASDDVEVPLRGGWIDLGCRASGNRKNHPRPRRSKPGLAADPVVLAPGRGFVEIYLRTKSEMIDRLGSGFSRLLPAAVARGRRIRPKSFFDKSVLTPRQPRAQKARRHCFNKIQGGPEPPL
jgi:hypothetical protein